MNYFFSTKPVLIFLSAVLMLSITSCGAPSDKTIREDVSRELAKNPDFKSITSDVKDGVVTLTGDCKTGGCDSSAAVQVKQVKGVKSIENNIHKNLTTDLTLRTSVQSIISKYAGVQADVAAGVIVLRGTIEKNQVEPLMIELQALKPKKLDNQLAVK